MALILNANNYSGFNKAQIASLVRLIQDVKSARTVVYAYGPVAAVGAGAQSASTPFNIFGALPGDFVSAQHSAENTLLDVQPSITAADTVSVSCKNTDLINPRTLPAGNVTLSAIRIV